MRFAFFATLVACGFLAGCAGKAPNLAEEFLKEHQALRIKCVGLDRIKLITDRTGKAVKQSCYGYVHPSQMPDVIDITKKDGNIFAIDITDRVDTYNRKSTDKPPAFLDYCRFTQKLEICNVFVEIGKDSPYDFVNVSERF